MHLNTTVRDIGVWADGTFGPGETKARCLRLLAEVVETCIAAGAGISEIDDQVDAVWLKNDDKPAPAKVPEELADCFIVLATIVRTAKVDLEYQVVKKMEINKARTWNVTGGGCGQHA
jgi:NTP pyrophosphatase (non-canonical NTP hydrolase)